MPNNSIFKERQTEKIPLNTGGEIIPVLPEDEKVQLRELRAFRTILNYLLSGSNVVTIDEEYLDNLSSGTFGPFTDYPVRLVTSSGEPTNQYGTSKITDLVRDRSTQVAIENVVITEEQANFFKKLLRESSSIRKEVSETSRDIRAFVFILSYLLSGSTAVNIDEEYLDNLSSGTFAPFADYPVRLVTSSGEPTDQYGTRKITDVVRDRFSQVAIENVVISKEQANFLKKLIKNSTENINLERDLRRDSRAFDSILLYLLSGSNEVNVDEEYLDRLGSGTFGPFTDYPVRLVTSSGEPTSQYGTRKITDIVRDRSVQIEVERVRLSQNDLTRLKEILKYSKDSNQAISKNFIIYIKALLEDVDSSKKEELINTLQAIFAEAGRLDEFDSLIPSIDEFIEFFKFRKFQIKILQELNRNLSVEEVQLLITRIELYNYPSKVDLLTRARKKKDSIYISQSLVLLSQLSSNIEVSEAIEVTNLLIKSLSNIENAEIRNILNDLAQKRELALIRRRLYEEIKAKKTPEEISIVSSAFPNDRVSFNDNEFNYLTVLQSYVDRAVEITSELRELDLERISYNIRLSFERKSFDEVIASIDEIPVTSEKARVIKIQLLQLYRKYLTENNITEFNERFGNEINRILVEEKKKGFQSPELGKNKEAFNYIRDRFSESIFPLYSFLRSNPVTRQSIISYERTKKDSFRVITKLLQKQREERGQVLTEEERRYLESVELLSFFNPRIVACLKAGRELSKSYLKYFFTLKSQKTQTELIRRQEEEPEEVAYYPLVQIGLGPNGLASLGEIARNNPTLASRMLTIDSGSQPGGPFSVPGGPAWRLNSASSKGTVRVIPDSAESLGLDPSKTVRGYGSVLRTYPGERAGSEVRTGGDINQTVDYLPNLTETAKDRYATNDELALLLSMQAALLVNNLCLETKVIRVEKNHNPDIKGTKILTLEITTPEGKRIVKISTDAVFVATGLGEPTYGIKLAGSRAEKVLEDSKELKLPKIFTTLESFKYLVRTAEEKESSDKELTVVIWGGGNSADTLIEYIGELFSSDSEYVRNIVKIYVISNQDLSARPRYAQIRDLRPRNGRGNLVEIIPSRVADVDYVSTDQEVVDRKIQFFDKNGQIILDSRGIPVTADFSIAATGFRSTINEIFSDFIPEGETAIRRSYISLPTDDLITVAESIEEDPTIVFLGTASNPNFIREKILQLPKEAGLALGRNGAENAVAIGFRAPDVQAAVNIFLNSLDIDELLTEIPVKEEVDLRLDSEVTQTFEGLNVPVLLSEEEVADIRPKSDVLNEILSFILCQFALKRIEIKADGPIQAIVSIKFIDGEFVVSTAIDGSDATQIKRQVVPIELPAEFSRLFSFLNDEDIQRLIISYFKSKDLFVSQVINFQISIDKGKINFQKTKLS